MPDQARHPKTVVLVFYANDEAALRERLSPVLDRLYDDGIVADHPDGASKGWEWT